MRDFLKKMYEAIDAGMSLKEFAKSIDKTPRQVHGMKHNYVKKGVKLPKFPHPSDWTQKEIFELKTQLNANAEYRNIKVGNKTLSAIKNKISGLGLTGDGIPRPKWTDEETEQLKDMIRRGLKRRTIEKRLNRTKSSVQLKINRLGLSKTGNYARKIPEGIVDTYEGFLIKFHMTMTPSDISDSWNNNCKFKTTPGMVRYHLRRLNIKCSPRHTWNLKNEKNKREEAARKTQKSQD